MACLRRRQPLAQLLAFLAHPLHLALQGRVGRAPAGINRLRAALLEGTLEPVKGGIQTGLCLIDGGHDGASQNWLFENLGGSMA